MEKKENNNRELKKATNKKNKNVQQKGYVEEPLPQPKEYEEIEY